MVFGSGFRVLSCGLSAVGRGLWDEVCSFLSAKGSGLNVVI